MVKRLKRIRPVSALTDDGLDLLDDQEDFFDGFPDENMECKVFKTVGRTDQYCGTLSTPVTIDDIKETYGPGTFVLYVRKDNKIYKKKKVSIWDERNPDPGPVRDPAQVQVPAQGSSLLSGGVGELKDIIEVVGSLTKNSNTASEQSTKLLETMMAMMGTVSAGMLAQMNGQIEMASKMRDLVEKTESGGPLGAVTEIVKEVSKTVSEYLKFRGQTKPALALAPGSKNGSGPAPVQEPGSGPAPVQDLVKVSIVDVLNDMAMKNDRDFDFIMDYMDRFYPDLLKAIDQYDFDVLFPQLVTMGLIQDKKDYFYELYKNLRTEIVNDPEGIRKPGNIPDSGNIENTEGQIQNGSQDPGLHPGTDQEL